MKNKIIFVSIIISSLFTSYSVFAQTILTEQEFNSAKNRAIQYCKDLIPEQISNLERSLKQQIERNAKNIEVLKLEVGSYNETLSQLLEKQKQLEQRLSGTENEISCNNLEKNLSITYSLYISQFEKYSDLQLFLIEYNNSPGVLGKDVGRLSAVSKLNNILNTEPEAKVVLKKINTNISQELKDSNEKEVIDNSLKVSETLEIEKENIVVENELVVEEIEKEKTVFGRIGNWMKKQIFWIFRK